MTDWLSMNCLLPSVAQRAGNTSSPLLVQAHPSGCGQSEWEPPPPHRSLRCSGHLRGLVAQLRADCARAYRFAGLVRNHLPERFACSARPTGSCTPLCRSAVSSPAVQQAHRLWCRHPVCEPRHECSGRTPSHPPPAPAARPLASEARASLFCLLV